MKRRLKAAGLPGQFSPHSFRVATVTDLLERNVPLGTCSTWPGTPTRGRHSFRVATVTDLLERNVPLGSCSTWPGTPTRGRPGCGHS